MPNTMFTHQEAVRALCAAAGISTGRHMLIAAFANVVTNVGIEGHGTGPGVVLNIKQIGVAPAQADSPAEMVVDLDEGAGPKASAASETTASGGDAVSGNTVRLEEGSLPAVTETAPAAES